MLLHGCMSQWSQSWKSQICSVTLDIAHLLALWDFFLKAQIVNVVGHMASCSYLILPLWCESHHQRQYVNKRVWLSSNKTLFVKTSSSPTIRNLLARFQMIIKKSSNFHILIPWWALWENKMSTSWRSLFFISGSLFTAFWRLTFIEVLFINLKDKYVALKNCVSCCYHLLSTNCQILY